MLSTWRGPVVAIVALLILGGIYLVWTPAEEAQAPEPEEEEIPITSVDWEEVVAVEVDWADEYQFRIERSEGDGYHLTSPGSYPTDQERAELLFKSAAKLQADRVVATGDEAEPEEFGLTQPRRHIKLQMEDGEEIVVDIGDPTPVQAGEHTSRYARLAGGGDIYLIPGVRLDFYASPLEKWRDKAIVRMEDVVEASVTAARGTWTARRGDGIYEWELVEPHRAPGDDSSLENFVREMRNLRADEFVEDDPTREQLEEWDLIEGISEVRLVNSAGDAVEVIIGKFVDSQASEVYVKRKDRDTVYKCVTGFYSAPGFSDLREWIAEKPFSVASRSDIVSVATENEDGSTQLLQRDDEEWLLTIDGGEGVAMEGTEVNKYLDELRNAALRDVHWPDDLDESTDRALDEYIGTITVTFGEAGDRQELEMTFAGADDENSGTYATIPGYDTILVFPPETRGLVDVDRTLQSLSE